MTDVFTYPTRRSRWSARDLPQLRDEPRDGGFRDTAGEAVALRVSNIDHPPERLLDRGLRRTPGEKICYSNFGFGLLGTVLALRAPTSYEQLVRERICEPLGRSTTPGSQSRPRPLPRFADGHNRRGYPMPHWELPALAGAGALRSTVADLLRFLELQLRDPTTRLGRAARATHEPRAHRGRLAQGLGWVSMPSAATTRCSGKWQRNGFRSFTGFVKETETGVVVLSGCARSVDAIGFRVLEAITQP